MMKVGENYGHGWWVHANGIGYLRDDMTTHKGMTGSGGTYFKTREEAQTAADRFNNLRQETGTLQELNVKPGDVLECVDDRGLFFEGNCYAVDQECRVTPEMGLPCITTTSKFRVIYRAPDDTPKKWRDMADAEKGALEKMGSWMAVNADARGIDLWNNMCDALGIKPESVTVELYGRGGDNGWAFDYCTALSTHRITFNTINGTPDPDTIKMERI